MKKKLRIILLNYMNETVIDRALKDVLDCLPTLEKQTGLM